MNVVGTTKILEAEVQELRHLTNSTFIIRIERKNLEFTAGQYLRIGFPGNLEMREYSIYSSEHDNYLEILVKEIIGGEISKKLKKCNPGDKLLVDGPFGFFNIEKKDRDKKFLFIASGTGIAPFHSFIKTYPGLDYVLLHGVANSSEAYGIKEYSRERYKLCTTKDDKGDFKGRVTDFLIKHRLDPNMLVYLCGNSNMIYDSFEILQTKGFLREQLYTEAYF